MRDLPGGLYTLNWVSTVHGEVHNTGHARTRPRREEPGPGAPHCRAAAALVQLRHCFPGTAPRSDAMSDAQFWICDRQHAPKIARFVFENDPFVKDVVDRAHYHLKLLTEEACQGFPEALTAAA